MNNVVIRNAEILNLKNIHHDAAEVKIQKIL